ncbi:TPA: hypothetical protein QDB04_000007 [Burkholderia vietnamiensis]|nr:hypothetical protein [Burkholderia vietnamiensis]
MPDWLTFCNTVIREQFPAVPEHTNWRDTTGWMMTFGAPGDPHYTLSKNASEFRTALYADYETVEPEPGYVERSANWREWDADDPLKACAEAAFVALQDLRRSVRVRDAAIDAFGEVAESRRTVKEPPVAGFPSGQLGNLATREFAELHGLVMKMGKGNARRGIAKMMKLAGQA